MAIKIKAEKVVWDGKPMYLVTKCKMMGARQINNKRYFKGFPKCVGTTDPVSGCTLWGDLPDTLKHTFSSGTVCVGDYLTPEQFKDLCKFVKKCGDRLHKLNLSKIKENWKGEVTVKI